MEAQQTRQEEMDRLAKRLAELMVEDQRRAGMFDGVPSFIDIEQAAHELAQHVSRVAQERGMREVVANAPTTACCPGCDAECELNVKRRTVQSKDGPVELDEPEGYCPRCRRAFFPSEGRTYVR